MGLTVENLAEAIGAIGQESMVLTRLYDLKIRKQVTSHINGAWAVCLGKKIYFSNYALYVSDFIFLALILVYLFKIL